MNGIGANGFNKFSLGNFQYITPGQNENMINFYKEFTEKTHDFRVLTSRIAEDIAKLKKKYDSNPSEKLQQIIAQKDQFLQQLNQILEKTREAYFSEGKAISDRCDAYLSVQV
jgi:ElaB/YqjD/DUF883 family membrane-anchored ribosome-binding protein